ncbi:RidA family protein [Acidiferrimicrobium sp. IK]|uniref:RidA family protein n=1 Tax=Acidiferrimicrobium sp. IK TaxID=2871700 RepID=UPI0021CB3C16|nr:RidA family protein [Acidiferrimicrobium sp. IK]MCU4187239.1 RidA family protein [Acidiferrimicrobium sp. IK]
MTAGLPPGGQLPPPPVAQGHYQPVVVHQGIAYTAGMTPRRDGALIFTGRVGADLDPVQARQATALATANALSAVAAGAGGLDRVERVLTMTVWIAAAADFTGHTAVADGGSALLADMLGSPPAARAAIGVTSLPGGAPVEVALVAAIRAAGDL